MVACAVDGPAAKLAAPDPGAVGELFHVYAQCTKAVGHDTDTVSFLVAQLAGTPDNGLPGREGRGDEDHGKLVDGQRN